jgi:hypothetical protein
MTIGRLELELELDVGSCSEDVTVTVVEPVVLDAAGEMVRPSN